MTNSRQHHQNFIIAGYLNEECEFQRELFLSGISLKKARNSFNQGAKLRRSILNDTKRTSDRHGVRITSPSNATNGR
jgi:hypothetical protein